MRAPPAVSVDAVAGRGWRVVQSLLHAAAAMAPTAWAAAWLEASAWGWSTVVGAGVAGAVLGWRLAAVPAARLSWSAGAWTVAAGADEPVPIAVPQVMLDLGSWMLLRSRPESGGRAGWLTVDADAAGVSWHLFRAAVYSSAAPAPPRSSEERPPH